MHERTAAQVAYIEAVGEGAASHRTAVLSAALRKYRVTDAVPMVALAQFLESAGSVEDSVFHGWSVGDELINNPGRQNQKRDRAAFGAQPHRTHETNHRRQEER